jgi:hypothetical protein
VTVTVTRNRYSVTETVTVTLMQTEHRGIALDSGPGPREDLS